MTILWDDEPGGNVEHLAEHGVTPEEFEQVFRRYFHGRQRSRSQPDRWVVQGLTAQHRYLIIVFEWYVFEQAIDPVTAYEPAR